MSSRAIVDWLVTREYELADGRIAGEWMNGCFVWLEQPAFSALGDKISFFARGKCPTDEIEALLAKGRSLLEEYSNSSSNLETKIQKT